MAAGSAIPAVKAAVVDLLLEAAYPALPVPYVNGTGRPQITYGEPKDAEPDRIDVLDSAYEPGAQEFLAFDGSRLEIFELKVLIASEMPGLSCQEAVERAFGMFGVFAAVIRAAALASPKLGLTGVMSVEVRQPQHRESRTTEGWAVGIETGVRATAQISPVVL